MAVALTVVVGDIVHVATTLNVTLIEASCCCHAIDLIVVLSVPLVVLAERVVDPSCVGRAVGRVLQEIDTVEGLTAQVCREVAQRQDIIQGVDLLAARVFTRDVWRAAHPTWHNEHPGSIKLRALELAVVVPRCCGCGGRCGGCRR